VLDLEGDEGGAGGEPPSGEPAEEGDGDGLAEVTRVRQFFPETWLWVPDRLTDSNGGTTFDLEAPDSITTWRLHAVSTSDSGLGVAESELVVFQKFFGEIDLPYAVTRGEDFPVRVQIFNYLDTAQTVQVDLDLTESDWFDLLDDSSLTVTVDANSVAGAWFLIGPTEVGRHTVKVTFRSAERADAVERELLVQPEGTTRELVQNGILREGETVALDTVMPEHMVPDSGRILLSVTPSLVAQSMDGVGDLLGMPYGCGEQNMIFLAPDVEILRYLDATDQLIPEIQAEAEHFITVGYQRELTYQREDGSFSAFGDSDEIGSLWLSAFVLGTFSGARDIMTIDATVLTRAAQWIEGHQLGDGSWEPVGFVHHSEMIGGVEGTYALTAFVALALMDLGGASAGMLGDAVNYLAANLTTVYDDPYALAIAALAFARLDNPSAGAAIDRLLELAVTDKNGIHWTPFDIETTAYAALAFMEEDMTTQANDAIKWISLQRNSLGGYGNTQDTVMALKKLIPILRVPGR
jgi:CD109 antigen